MVVMKKFNLTEEEKSKILGQHFPKRLNEDIESDSFEKGPFGMRAARSRADYEPAGSREVDLGSNLFGKYSEDVPPIAFLFSVTRVIGTVPLYSPRVTDIKSAIIDLPFEPLP